MVYFLSGSKELSVNKLPNLLEPVSVQFLQKLGANALRLIYNSVSYLLTSPTLL